jgi:tetratricopeptide (TPR) repeat protein
MKTALRIVIFLILSLVSAFPIYAVSRANTHFSMGYYFLYENDLEAALDQFELSLLFEEDPPSILFSILAEVHHLLGNGEHARKYALMALKYDGHDESALQTVSLIHVSEGEYEAALPYLELLREKKPDDIQVLLYLAEAYNSLEDEDRLIETYGQILKYHPDFLDVALNLGYLYTKRGAFIPAEEQFKHVLELDPDNERALFYLTYIYISTGKTEGALEMFRSLDDRNLLSQDTLQDYALNLFIEGQNPEPVLRRIENWDDVSPTLQGIRSYVEGDLDRADGIFRQLFQNEPDNLAALVGLVAIAEQRREVDAEKRWRFMLASSYYRYRRYEKARDESLIVKAMDSFHLENRYLLGDTYGFLGDTERAIQEYEFFKRYAEEPGDVHIKLGIAYDQMGEHEKAIENFKQASIIFPENDEVLYYLGIEYRIVKDFNRAIEVFNRAIQLNDQDARYYFHLGVSYERLGMIEQAIHYLDRSVQLDDSSATSLNYLGYLLADGGIRLQEARIMIEKALALDPENGAYLDSMGWVLYRLREFNKAREYLESAVEFADSADEENYVIFEHLGDVYYQIGLIEEAVDAWQEALKMKYTEEIQQKIDNARGEMTE